MIENIRSAGDVSAFYIEGEQTVLSWREVFNKLPASVRPGVSENPSSDKEHAVWGLEDNLPQLLQAAAEDDTVILPGVRFKSEMQYGGGISYGFRRVDSDGDEYFEAIIDEEIEDFLHDSSIDFSLMQMFLDLNFSAMAFPQLILNEALGARKIVRMMCHTTRAKNCRVDVVDVKGNHKEVAVNMDHGSSSYSKSTTTKIKALPEYGKLDFIKENQDNISQFIFVLKIPDLGRLNHMQPDWNTARNSGWMDISKVIAMFKKYLMENQASIKYHIHIDMDYWPMRFGKEEWNKMDISQKQSAQQAELNAWKKFMKGSGGAGNVHVSSMEWLDRHQMHREFWKIEELKGHITKDGVYVEDSREASEHKISALGLHQSMIGNAPGGSLGAGSGSGNRVAFNQRLSMAKFAQDRALAPLNLIARFNGWHEKLLPRKIEGEKYAGKLEFRVRNSLITTLDTGAEATKPSPSA